VRCGVPQNSRDIKDSNAFSLVAVFINQGHFGRKYGRKHVLSLKARVLTSRSLFFIFKIEAERMG